MSSDLYRACQRVIDSEDAASRRWQELCPHEGAERDYHTDLSSCPAWRASMEDNTGREAFLALAGVVHDIEALSQ